MDMRRRVNYAWANHGVPAGYETTDEVIAVVTDRGKTLNPKT